MLDIYIVHGYRADPAEHWFPWLAQKLSEWGNNVSTLELPNPLNPQRMDWVETLQDKIGTPTADTVIITHSLGGITTLDYLSKVPGDWSLAGLIMVSPFQGKLTSIPDLDIFLTDTVDTVPFIDKICYTSVIHSDNDEIVPPAASVTLAQELGAKTIEIPDGSHFLLTEGFSELPLVLEEIAEICSVAFR